MAVRAAVLQAGAKLLEDLLAPVGVGRRTEPVACACGCAMRSTGRRAKRLATLLGSVAFARTRFQCPACATVRFPGDEALGVVNTSRSPGLQRQVARLGAKEPFEEVSKDLAALAGIELCRKEAERIAEGTGADIEQWDARERMQVRRAEPPPPEAPKTIDTLYIQFDGTGVPMVPHEVAGRNGKQPDGSAKTREVKLGCVFTQHTFDERGRPIRDPASTTFVGAIEEVHTFGAARLYPEAVRRGLYQAKRVVCIGDGAEWVKNLAATHFGDAQFILDFYHAKEHVSALCRTLFTRDLKRLNQTRERWWELLANGQIQQLIDEATRHLPRNPEANKDARREIGYLEKNQAHMDYARYKEQGLFIGSGVIEAGCKTIVCQRLKQSGMEWTVPGANAIIALRCAELSGRTEEYWEQRAA